MSLLDLPNELLLSVAGRLRSFCSINALTRTNYRLYCLLDAYLYQYYIQKSDQSAFLWAARHGLTNTVLKFLDLGANLQAKLDDKNRATALYLASRHGHLLIVEALIQSGVDVNAQAYGAVIPLHGAVAGGHNHITQALLENGADFMKVLPTRDRPTILHIACYFGYLDIVQLLLDKGMGIQAKDRNLRTPLHYAVIFDKKSEIWHGNITTVNFLLEKKAVKDSWDKRGQRPKDLAKRNPNSIIELLLLGTTNTALNEAILLDETIQQQRRKKKELEQERIRKMHELAAERAAKLKAREAEKKAKEQLLRKTEESEEYQNRAGKKRLDDIRRYEKQHAIQENWAKARMAADNNQRRIEIEDSRKQQNHASEVKPTSTEDQKKQDAARESWRKLKADAEGRSQTSPKPTRKPCSHSDLGLLKWKGKGRCDSCEITFVKHLFRCADCGFIACRRCKTVN